MPHFYVSIPGLGNGREVFKYAGYVHPLNQDFHQRCFEKFGVTGLPGAKGGPYKVLLFDEYKDDRITEDGKPFGLPLYTPKQIILTKREGGKLWRIMWAKRSSPEAETKGREHAREEGWIFHAFQVDDTSAWEKALVRHEEIESHEPNLENPENWVDSSRL